MYSLRFKNELPAIVAKEFEAFLTALKGWIAVDHNEDGTHHVAPQGLEVPVGAILAWGTTTAPAQWLLCDGAAYSRTDYGGLFNVIGTTYGAPSGSTFNVPDLRQRFPLGKAASGTGSTLGATGGAIDHTHTLSGGTTSANGGFSTSTGASGGHGHALSGSTGFDAGGSISVQVDGGGPAASILNHTHSVSSAAADTVSDHVHSMTQGDHTHSISGGSSSDNNPAYQVVNFIILAGV